MGPSNDRELAQLVERHPYKVDVAGSNPVLPTNFHLENWLYRNQNRPSGGFFVSTPYLQSNYFQAVSFVWLCSLLNSFGFLGLWIIRAYFTRVILIFELYPGNINSCRKRVEDLVSA